jgi:uncharacterized membrane protein
MDHGLLFLVSLLTLVIALLFPYFFRLFQEIGFTPAETFSILILPFLVDYFLKPLHIGEIYNLDVYIDVAGFLIPLSLTIRFLSSRRAPITKTLVGIFIVSFVVYSSSSPSHFGVLVNNVLVIVIVTSLYSLYVSQSSKEMGPIAYSTGSMGVIIGADIANLPAFMDFSSSLRFTMGGGGVLDAIFVVSLLAVILDLGALVIRRTREEDDYEYFDFLNPFEGVKELSRHEDVVEWKIDDIFGNPNVIIRRRKGQKIKTGVFRLMKRNSR